MLDQEETLQGHQDLLGASHLRSVVKISVFWNAVTAATKFNRGKIQYLFNSERKSFILAPLKLLKPALLLLFADPL